MKKTLAGYILTWRVNPTAEINYLFRETEWEIIKEEKSLQNIFINLESAISNKVTINFPEI